MRIPPLTLTLTLVLTSLSVVGCTNEQDRADALRAADRIHSFAKKQDFASIYRESSDSFKQEGDDSKFIELMRSIYEGAGALKDTKPVAYQNTINSKEGKQHILISDVEFERARGRERLVFTRAKSGELQLAEIVIEPTN